MRSRQFFQLQAEARVVQDRSAAFVCAPLLVSLKKLFGGDVLDAVGVNLDQELQPRAGIELRLDGCLADAGDATGGVERLHDLNKR